MLKVTKEQLIQEVNDLVSANSAVVESDANLRFEQTEYERSIENANEELVSAERRAAAMRINAGEKLQAAKASHEIARQRLTSQIAYLQALIAGEDAGEDPTPLEQLELPLADGDPKKSIEDF